MPRPVGVPPLPTTPGGWLACYRYRLKTEDGSPCSQEHLGKQLGVSRDTLRRWEAGTAVPTCQDLMHFAEVCQLRPIERAFLLDSFSTTQAEVAPSKELFRAHANALLGGEFPAYLFDSLFYVRAWNSHIDLVHTMQFDLEGSHRLETLLSPIANQYEAGLATREERQGIWMRDFWYRTAKLCGSPSYVRVIERLTQHEKFAKRWLALALDFTPEQEKPVGYPYFLKNPANGTFRISTSTVALPPNYYLREFVPLDSLAWEKMKERHMAGPPDVTITDRIHWSAEPT